MVPNSDHFRPHPLLDSAINRAICQSEIEGGVFFDELPVGAVLDVETRHHTYTVENRGDGKILIVGHPTYCPQPVLVNLHGSTWGTALIKRRFIGRGMRMEFIHPTHGVVRTSPVREIRELPPAPQSDRLERKAN